MVRAILPLLCGGAFIGGIYICLEPHDEDQVPLLRSRIGLDEHTGPCSRPEGDDQRSVPTYWHAFSQWTSFAAFGAAT